MSGRRLWTEADISVETVDDLIDHPVATLLIDMPAGRLTVMAELVPETTRLIVRGAHINGFGANLVGHANLMLIGRMLKRELGFDELIVEGALRTTGARPGHRPRRIRF